jgi:hypothetical protein
VASLTLLAALLYLAIARVQRNWRYTYNWDSALTAFRFHFGASTSSVICKSTATAHLDSRDLLPNEWRGDHRKRIHV